MKRNDFLGKLCKTLLTETDFYIEKIASLVGVSISFIEEIKASL